MNSNHVLGNVQLTIGVAAVALLGLLVSGGALSQTGPLIEPVTDANSPPRPTATG